MCVTHSLFVQPVCPLGMGYGGRATLLAGTEEVLVQQQTKEWHQPRRCMYQQNLVNLLTGRLPWPQPATCTLAIPPHMSSQAHNESSQHKVYPGRPASGPHHPSPCTRASMWGSWNGKSSQETLPGSTWTS